MKRLMTIAIRDFGILLENCIVLWNRELIEHLK